MHGMKQKKGGPGRLVSVTITGVIVERHSARGDMPLGQKAAIGEVYGAGEKESTDRK
jgi:hypothetical protein